MYESPLPSRILQDYEKGVFFRHHTGLCKEGVSFVGNKGYNREVTVICGGMVAFWESNADFYGLFLKILSGGP